MVRYALFTMGRSSGVVRKLSYAFNLGNGQFNGEMPVWRSHSRKRLKSRKENETRLKLVGHNIRRVGYLEIMGDVVPHWRRSAGS